jgi:hypothetical protein
MFNHNTHFIRALTCDGCHSFKDEQYIDLVIVAMH